MAVVSSPANAVSSQSAQAPSTSPARAVGNLLLFVTCTFCYLTLC